jgi:hypothetical protein
MDNKDNQINRELIKEKGIDYLKISLKNSKYVRFA